jgi:hypothetical protein
VARYRFGRAVAMAYELRFSGMTSRRKAIEKLGFHRTCDFFRDAALAHRGVPFALTRSRDLGYTREIFGPKKCRLHLRFWPGRLNLPENIPANFFRDFPASEGVHTLTPIVASWPHGTLPSRMGLHCGFKVSRPKLHRSMCGSTPP